MGDQSFMPDEPERPVGTPGSKKKKPVQLWYRLSPAKRKGSVFGVLRWNRWSRWGRYKDYDTARKVMSDEERKYPGLWEFKIGNKPRGEKK